MTTPRFSSIVAGDKKAFGEQPDPQKKNANRFTEETVLAVRDDGRYNILGSFIPATGTKQFKVGERVIVAFRDETPLSIIGHTWRRAEYPTTPEEEIGVSKLEIVAIGSAGGGVGVFVVSELGVVVLDPNAEGAGMNVSDVSWGLNQNAFIIRYNQKETPFKESLRSIKINRPLTGRRARSLPTKKDSNGDVLKDETTGLPILDATQLADILVIDNIPLGRNFTLKENFKFRHRASLGFAELFNPNNPQPGKIDGVESDQVVNFEQTTPMNLDIEQLENLASNAYEITYQDSFLDINDKIIVIYSIKWNIGSLWDQTFTETETNEGCGDVTGPNIVNVNLRMGFTPPFEVPADTGFDRPFASPFNPISCVNRSHRTSVLCPTPPCSQFPIGNGIQHDDVAGTNYITFSEIPYGHLFAHPQESFDFPDLGDFFDVFVMNRETNQIIGASFTDPTWEYDREMVFYLAAGTRRQHFGLLFQFNHPDSIDLRMPFIDGTFSLRTGFLGSSGFSTGFVGTGQYYREVASLVGGDFQETEFGSGILDLDLRNTIAPDTIKNIRVTGRDFHDLRDPEPFDDNIIQRTFFLRSAVEEVDLFSGNRQIIDRPSNSFTLDVAERTRKKPETEVEFQFNRFLRGQLPNVRLGNHVVFQASRNVDEEASPGLVNVTPYEWQIGSPGQLVQVAPAREAVGLETLLQSHEAAIFVQWSDDENIKVFLRKGSFLLDVESFPTDLTFVLPDSYTNDKEKDRRIYKLTVNDENKVVFEKTDVPATDLLEAADITAFSVPSFHLVRTRKQT